MRYRTDFPVEKYPSLYQSIVGQCWNAQQLAEITGGEWIVPPPPSWYVRSVSYNGWGIDDLPGPILDIAISSRLLRRQAPFFAGAVVGRPIEDLPTGFPQLLVKNPATAMIELGFAARRRFRGKLIAVTGSCGKTTTVAMIKKILSKDHYVPSTFRTYNHSFGIGMLLANLCMDTEFAVVEESHAFLQQFASAADLKPHVAVITSIVEAHLNDTKDLENIARIKSSIFHGMEPGGYAVVNRDCPYFELILGEVEKAKLQLITFGLHPESMIKIGRLADGEKISVFGKEYILKCHVSPYQILDALAAIGVSEALKIPMQDVLPELESYESVNGRNKIQNMTYYGKHITVINGTFNANEASMRDGLKYLAQIGKQEDSRVAILGDIAELGERAVPIHKNLAKDIISCRVNRVILSGTYMRYLYDEVKELCNCVWFPSLKDLMTNLKQYLKEDDVVFIKSSHSTQFHKIVNHIQRQYADETMRSAMQVTASHQENLLEQMTASAVIAIDLTNHQTCYEKNADMKLYPASLTKMLTCIIALERCDMEEICRRRADDLIFSDKNYAALVKESGCYMKLGELLKGMMLRSNNEMAEAVARHVSGSIQNFSILMNEKARQIGLSENSHFANPHGIDNIHHYSTARDMAKLAAYCWRNEQFRALAGMKESVLTYLYPPRKIRIKNTNEMLHYYEGCKGIKTGITPKAGGNLCTLVERNNRKILSVVMHSENGVTRFTDTANLMNYILM
ncbi:UDP-N-acetylmuramyl pentapeptide synthase [Selenomonas sp. KH1T6]|nr:UDP-N-acetylmuramyl pentapeptide synthase [Selenomonas ruminantium]